MLCPPFRACRILFTFYATNLTLPCICLAIMSRSGTLKMRFYGDSSKLMTLCNRNLDNRRPNRDLIEKLSIAAVPTQTIIMSSNHGQATLR